MKAYAGNNSSIGKEGFLPLHTDGKAPSSLDAVQLKTMLASRLNVAESQAWFSPLSFSFSASPSRRLTAHLPHELFFRWFCDTGKSTLESSVRAIFGDIDIVYAWPEGNGNNGTLSSGVRLAAPKNPSFTFESFIPGGKNREAFQLLRRSIHTLHGPIFLHGPSGTGKSHLLHASAAELGTLLEGKVSVFSGRELLPLFHNSPEQAYTTLSTCAAVLIDDIQMLEGDKHVQRELAALLDACPHIFFLAAYQTDGNDESGQKLLPLLYDRLCSHLSLGLAEPDLDVRLRFTQASMDRMGLPEQRELALFLARHCLRLRHIRGVLEQIRLSYEQSPVLPPIEELSSLLGRAGVPQPIDTDTILAVVASHYGCTSSELCENTKDRRITLPRQIAMYLCRELLGESYPSLGLLFGGKDHSTVMYATRKIEKLKVTNKDMNIQLTELTKQCRNGLPRRDC